MCLYNRAIYSCNHFDYILAYNCYDVFFQLQRINDSWERSNYAIPFELSPNCSPSLTNIIGPIYSPHPCDVCLRRDRERRFFEGASCFFSRALVGTGGDELLCTG
ncbi:hypothetical protein CIRG_04392 [Coccidioides immitis RMSCC 2394]|uniref:Uncharacterized protein n=1 Tax=Coccidioides immitis RMSCC 2394 TaxID=404692 RepID=A0A0J6Y7Q9_COCIT|nr:hypothetical protein CIRG_04392 [Coccidioides immitis RMSCC 2394]